MNIGEILGAVVQAGMSPSTTDRMKHSLGGKSVLDGLVGALASSGQAGGSGGGLGSVFSSVLSGRKSSTGGGGIGDLLSGILGGGQRDQNAAANTAVPGGGIGDLLSNVLGEAGKAVGSNKNLAIGSLGALVGSLLGGGKKSMGGAMGGGVMALLGAIAFNAIKASGQKQPQIPVGLVEPQNMSEKRQLEHGSELVLRAMINATKADGRVDQNEINRIMGKFSEIEVDSEGQQYLQNQLQRPMETEELIAAAKGQPELAAQMYAASLLAIEVDTPAEQNYLDQFASGLGLDAQVTGQIKQIVGLQ